MSRGRCVVAVAVAWVLTAGGGVFAETIWVPDDHETIQGAIDVAVDGDEIAVRPAPHEPWTHWRQPPPPGSYNEAIDFLGKAVRLYAYRGLRPPYARVRIDGTGLGTSVKCVNGEGPDTVLDGFVISGDTGTWREDPYPGYYGGGMLNVGSSPTIINCSFIDNDADREIAWGGGLSNVFSSPNVANCVFIRNVADAGGGMFNYESNPTVTNCMFNENNAAGGGGMWNNYSSPLLIDCVFSRNVGYYQGGGGVTSHSGSPTISRCTFIANVAGGTSNSPRGGGANLDGGTVSDCEFIGNHSWDSGGGMYTSGNTVVETCVFRDNSAQRGGGMLNRLGEATVVNCEFDGNTAGQGGGVSTLAPSIDLSSPVSHTLPFNAEPTITNCTFKGNGAYDGGGVYVSSGNEGEITRLRLVNCTFIGNAAEGHGPAIACDSWDSHDPSDVFVANSILWNGGDEIWNNNESTITITYSDVQGGYDGPGNIDAHPLCDADGRPQAGSPCIDAGVNNAVPTDTLDLDNDGDMAERLPLDLDGSPRFADDLDQDDTGCGLPVVVDMGAFEYQGVPVHPVLVGDVDGNGVVDVADILEVLAVWGECDPECCLADVDFTWRVDVADLLPLLANWG